MKSPLLYIFEVLFCSGLFLVLYRVLVLRKVSFVAHRRFLLAAVLLSAIIPALDIPLYPARTVVSTAPAEIFFETVDNSIPVTPVSNPSVDRDRLLLLIVTGLYGAILLLSLGFFVVRIITIRHLRRQSRLIECDGYILADNQYIITPFSFLRTIFLNNACESRWREIVLCHEASHVRHRHSAERIVVELFRCLFWFNPFVWIAGRWLQEVHEWEADHDVLEAGYDLTEYRTLIFHQLFGYNPDIACGLNHSLTKNRFAMMTQFKERRSAFLRFGAAIPVVAGMVMLCSFTVKPSKVISVEPTARPTATIRINAGGEIVCNGQPIALEELTAYIAAEREKLSESERANLEIVLHADKTTHMNAVGEVKEALRRANALRISYCTTSSDPGLLRMLPPDFSSNQSAKAVRVVGFDPRKSSNKSLPEGTIKARERNVCVVRINDSGTISVSAGEPYRETTIAPRNLPALIKSFILNASDDPKMPEKRIEEFALPDGSTMQYPVSGGIVFLATSQNTRFSKYLEVQRLIAEAFGEVRDELAQRQFGQDFASLGEPERQVITRAVPLKISESE